MFRDFARNGRGKGMTGHDVSNGMSPLQKKLRGAKERKERGGIDFSRPFLPKAAEQKVDCCWFFSERVLPPQVQWVILPLQWVWMEVLTTTRPNLITREVNGPNDLPVTTRAMSQ